MPYVSAQLAEYSLDICMPVRYYLRSKAAADAIKFTVDQQSLRRKSDADASIADSESSFGEEKECLSCGA